MYKIGTDVYCLDGKAGKLIKVVLDHHSHRITDLIVEKGLLVKQDRVIPVEAVQWVNENGILLSISSREMANYPEYREVEFAISEPAVLEELGYKYVPGDSLTWAARYGFPVESYRPAIKERVREGVDPDRALIGRGTRVIGHDGTAGYIDHLLVDDKSGEISHLVVRQGLLPSQLVIPMEMVERIEDESVYVRASREELEGLKQYTARTDARILAELKDQLAALKDIDLSQLQISLVNGLVKLAGPLGSSASQRVLQVAEGIEGVVGVENQMTTPDNHFHSEGGSTMNMQPNSRFQELEQKYSKLDSDLADSPEKEAFSVLHAMIQDTRRLVAGSWTEPARMDGVTLESVANLYKTAPKMEGKAERDGLPVESQAPDFTLQDANGKSVTLSTFRGKNVVLVFYPLDWSPACSDQLSLYQNELSEFEKLNTQVIGVSVDSLYSHGAWAAVRGITFPLLADFHPKGEVARLYNVFRDTDGFSERALYVIDREGMIRHKHISAELHHIPDIYELFEQLRALEGQTKLEHV